MKSMHKVLNCFKSLFSLGTPHAGPTQKLTSGRTGDSIDDSSLQSSALPMSPWLCDIGCALAAWNQLATICSCFYPKQLVFFKC